MSTGDARSRWLWIRTGGTRMNWAQINYPFARNTNTESEHTLNKWLYAVNTARLISCGLNLKAQKSWQAPFWDDSVSSSLIATNGSFPHPASSELASQTAAEEPACLCQHVWFGCKTATAFCSSEQFDVIQVACGWVVATFKKQRAAEKLHHSVSSTTSKWSKC